jgi:hypothetical protein
VARFYVNSYYNWYHRRCSVTAPRSLKVKSSRKNHTFPRTTTYKCIYETYMEHILVKLTTSIVFLVAVAHDQPKYELKYLSSVLLPQKRPSINIFCDGIQKSYFWSFCWSRLEVFRFDLGQNRSFLRNLFTNKLRNEVSANSETFIEICESMFFIPLYPYGKIYLKNGFFSSFYFKKVEEGGWTNYTSL